MQIEFRHNNHLYTRIRVIGLLNSQDFDFLIDTGSTRTGIPLGACMALGLRRAGMEKTAGLYGANYLPLFHARLQIHTRPAIDTQIKGLPVNICLLGVDILSMYRMNVDWLSNPKTATAEY